MVHNIGLVYNLIIIFHNFLLKDIKNPLQIEILIYSKFYFIVENCNDFDQTALLVEMRIVCFQPFVISNHLGA